MRVSESESECVGGGVLLYKKEPVMRINYIFLIF